MRIKTFFSRYFAVPVFFIPLSVTAQVNLGFESTAPGTYSAASSVTGWTLSSTERSNYCNGSTPTWSPGTAEFMVHATPLTNVPVIGLLHNSPLGGSAIAQLNGFVGTDYKVNKLSQSFNVTSGNDLFRFAFAALFNTPNTYLCCDGPAIEVIVRNCSNQLMACQSQTIVPTNACGMSPPSFTFSNGFNWTSWQVRQIDLSPYIGSCITIEFVTRDCIYGGHYAVAYLDAECVSQNSIPNCNNCVNLGAAAAVSYCGNGPALIQAPHGYSGYQWVAPGTGTLNVPSATMSALTVTNPVPGAVYTVNMSTPSNCQLAATYTLIATQVSVTTIGSTGACSLGTNGSATVLPTGSGAGYNYVWTNSSNSVVSTSSVAGNLSSGDYSVMVTSPAGTVCGSATASINVAVQTPLPQHLSKPYCGSTAILNTPPATNHAWYSGSVLTSTAAVYTPSNPYNWQVYSVGYTSSQGCRDSIIFTLFSSTAIPVSVINNPMICEGASNGAAVFSLTPVGSYVPGTSGFTVSSTGQTPTFLYASTNSSGTTFTVSGLTGGGTYSITGFDGSCFTSNSFAPSTFYTNNLFTLTPAWSPTLCAGSVLPLVTNFSGTFVASQFTYSWSPSAGLTSTNFPNVIVTPTAPSNSSAVTIYSLTVTPTLINCPATRTIAVLVSNPAMPSVSGPGFICTNHDTIRFSGNPVNGVFSANPGSGLATDGLLNPATAVPGVHTFSYHNTVNNCSATATSSYSIGAGPVLSVTGNTSICSGISTTLSASGAQNFLWGNASTSPQLIASPPTTTVVSLYGSMNNGCSDSLAVVVIVTPSPTLSVTGNQTICAGNPATLTAGGASAYFWSNGTTSPLNIVTPLVTTNYTLTGINLPAGCTDSLLLTITVNPSPTVNVSGSVGSCAGELIILKANGAQSYLWNGTPGAAIQSTVLNTTTIFTVTGIDQHSCEGKAFHLVVVDPCTSIGEYAALRPAFFPNPVAEELFLDLDSETEIVLRDAMGKTAFRRTFGVGLQKLDMSQLSKGVYFIEFRTDKGYFGEKIIKH